MTPARGHALALWLALAGGCVTFAAAPSVARAKSANWELGFTTTIQFGGTNDLLAFDGSAGLELGQPILGAFYLEPLVRMQFGLNGAMTVLAVARGNFVITPGIYFSIGFGAGEAITGEGSSHPADLGVSFRTVEISFKKGGKRRFGIDLATYFDYTGGLGTAFVVRTGFVWAGGI
jgi:hypothetical protein